MRQLGHSPDPPMCSVFPVSQECITTQFAESRDSPMVRLIPARVYSVNLLLLLWEGSQCDLNLNTKPKCVIKC